MKHDLSQQELALQQIDSCSGKFSVFFFFLFATLTVTVVIAIASVWSGKMMGCRLSRASPVPRSNCTSSVLDFIDDKQLKSADKLKKCWKILIKLMHSKSFNTVRSLRSLQLCGCYDSTI